MRHLRTVGLAVIFGLVGCFGFCLSADAAETVRVMTYTSYAPFIIDAKRHRGLAYMVADILTQRSHGRYQFEVEVIPRKRLDVLLKDGENVVIPFVDPIFFGDVKMTTYLWTSSLFADRQIMVFNPNRPLTFTGPDSLVGKVFGGIIGYHYPPLDSLVAEGKIGREDVIADDQNLLKLVANRVDAVCIPYLAFNFLKGSDIRFAGLQDAPQPLYPIERRFMIQGKTELRDFIEGAIQDSYAAPDWKAAFTTVLNNPQISR